MLVIQEISAPLHLAIMLLWAAAAYGLAKLGRDLLGPLLAPRRARIQREFTALRLLEWQVHTGRRPHAEAMQKRDPSLAPLLTPREHEVAREAYAAQSSGRPRAIRWLAATVLNLAGCTFCQYAEAALLLLIVCGHTWRPTELVPAAFAYAAIARAGIERWVETRPAPGAGSPCSRK